MAKSDVQDLLLAAHDLKGYAPNSWTAFIKALETYTQNKCVEAINAPNENAHVSRGHAQALLALLHTFSDLDGRYDAIQRLKDKHNRP